MPDDATTEASAPLPHCMWCSAELPSATEVTCPSCGATLIGEGDNQVPGVTAIDAEAIIRNSRTTKPKPRGRWMSWISGEYNEDEQPAAPGSLSPPPPAVRREILRLELEAKVVNLQGEAGALAAEAAVVLGTPINLPEVDPSAIAEAAFPHLTDPPALAPESEAEAPAAPVAEAPAAAPADDAPADDAPPA